jgi:hypothetical protein
MKMTLAEAQAHQAKVRAYRTAQSTPKARPEYVPARERRKGMNGLERAYAARLELRKHAGEIEWFEFEPMRLKLADDTYYRPDFGVMRERQLEFHECKGHMREAARVRLNVAASKFPFPFFLVKKDRTGFAVNRVGSVPRGTDE